MPQVDDDDDLSAFLALAMSDMPAPKAETPPQAAPAAPAVEASLDEFLTTAAVPESPAAVEASIEEFLSSREPDSEPEAVEAAPTAEPEGDDALSFLANSGLKRVRDVPDIIKPWMKHHTFTQVKTLAEVNQIVDECIKRGFCSLDLETQGLDNRIYYDAAGNPQTVHKIVGFCISYDGIEGFYIPVRHRPTDGGPDLNVTPVASVEQAISRLCHAAIPVGTPEAIEKDLLSYEAPRPQVVIAMWNAQFDQEFLYPITGIDWWHPSSFEDGMLAAFTKWAGDKALSLKKKAVQLLKDPDGNPYEMIELKELFDKGRKIQFDTLAPDEPGVLRYAGSDAICTYKLCQIPDLVPLCLEKYGFTYRLEKQTTCALRVMERNRVYITRDRVRETLREQEALRDDLLQKIRAFAWEQKQVRLDPNSPKQLGEFLFGTGAQGMGITPAPDKNEASGQYKTDGDTLEELAKAPNAPTILKEIVTYRELEKYIGTYLLNLANNPDENSELRFCFKQTGAASGRLSAPSGDPEQGQSGVPVHGIPGGSEVRRNFEARKGYTMAKCDYAGEELRIATNITNEPVWIKEFTYGTGDLHTITAQAFFSKQEVTKEERNAGKIANFSLLYGGGPKAIVRATGCDDMEARRRKQAFDKSVPVFAKWIKTQHEAVKRDLGVWTAFGRWLSIPDARHMDQAIRAACERHAVNYQIQGAGADIMKISMVTLHKAFHRKGWLRNGGDDSIRMLLTVHDEIVFEIKHERVAEAIPLIVEIMEAPWRRPKKPEWKVPLVVEPLVGFNWASGYMVERAKPGHKLSNTEVLINGFVYHTTRKPKIKNDVIVESLDTQEVVEGKKFRVVDPPWLMGRVPGVEDPNETTPSAAPDPAPTASPAAVEMPPADGDQAELDQMLEGLTESGPLAAPAPSAPSPALSAPPPASASPTTTSQSEVLKIAINQLNEQTAEQVCDFLLSSGDNDAGVVLHLTDIVGETLISPDRGWMVLKDTFIAKLRKHNLLCAE